MRCSPIWIGAVYLGAGNLALAMAWAGSLLVRLGGSPVSASTSVGREVATINSNAENHAALLGWGTIQGLAMVFLWAMPVTYTAMSNLLMALMNSTAEVVYPIVNRVGIVLFLGGTAVLTTFSALDGTIGVSWVVSPPLSTRYGTELVTSVVAPMINVVGASAAGGSLIVMTAIVCGTTLAYTSHIYASFSGASVLLLTSLPALTVCWVMMSFIGGSSALELLAFEPLAGGDCVYYLHLFWIFGHPEVYVLVLPALSIAVLVAAEGVAYGDSGMVLAILVITVMGLVVWAHHMYTTSISSESAAYFTAATHLVGIPSGLKAVHFLAC